ncbi:MAG: hydroxyacylglutathione hydrolase [Ketobacter sp.]|uniref:hydroxyacylglutathione hydrolase n=1 Tax=Ketobacter sp. MCCC 1A13808 TaxID=2602738 RepID=UPI0018DC2CCB|nr:hydroxyacylglutathione hydrolase [Ketobacter sp. MCCC 1A13808]
MLTLHPIPAYVDNYIWCIHDATRAYVVDPGQAEPVQSYLNKNKLALCGILVTHHHWDHVSGIETLTKEYPGLPVWGPQQETIPGITVPLSADQRVDLDWDISMTVLDVPGHTLGHIAYFAEQTPLGPLLFCGDTLFSSGCGRLFEGTPGQMWQSLKQFLALPDQTLVCCTHEYTTANLQFAQAVEPGNADITTRRENVASLRDQNLPSLPSTIGLEKRVNPFLRVNEDSVINALIKNSGSRPADATDSFAKLRAWKDSF